MDYSPLVAENNEIRLIKLLPRSEDAATMANDQQSEMLEFIMEHKSLNDARQVSGALGKFEYVALSYFWGSWEDSQLISVNGQITHMTKNLHDYLQMLSKQLRPPWIWVDALCINQKDIDERSFQVKRMRSIYERGFVVHAWVGASSKDSSSGIQFLKSIYEKGRTIVEDSRREELHLWLNERPVGSWCALFRFCNRPYWTRLWIIQEMTLNKNLSIICGECVIDWDILSTAIILLGVDPTGLHLRCQHDCEALGISSIPTDSISTLLRLMGIRKSYGEAEHKLGRVLSTIRASEQTEVKDRVYGALSMISPLISSRIEPNYRLSVSEIFIDFAKACIATTGSLEILRQARNNKTVVPKAEKSTDWASLKSCQGDTVPTWVPDLSQDLEDLELSTQIPYAASLDTVADVQFVSLNCLIARGFRVDIVDGLGSCMEHDAIDKERTLFTMKDSMEPSVEGKLVVQSTEELQKIPYHDEEGLRDALFKTLVAGLDDFTFDGSLNIIPNLLNLPLCLAPGDPLRSLSNESLYQKFVNICHCTQDFRIGGRPFINYFPEPGPQTAAQFPSPLSLFTTLCVACSTLNTRRLLVTEKGYVGVADHKAQRGNLIVILYGCPVPLILRPLQETGFMLVGEVYVHGIMQGKAMEWLANGECQLENFDIY
ncbi:HET-domain-containing protein [Stipitochalara longipes BDJ]|nr:HET-domain-containing protein [Stipitochalara longipes BDJ]